MNDIWPILLGAVISAIGMYVGFINKMRSQIAVIEDNVDDLQDKCKEATTKFEAMAKTMAVQEDKVKRIDSRQESHSKKYDELMSTINELKLEMVKQFSRLTSELNSFNSMVEASDDGVRIKHAKK